MAQVGERLDLMTREVLSNPNAVTEQTGYDVTGQWTVTAWASLLLSGRVQSLPQSGSVLASC